MRKIELLAPARNLACGIAAIDHGADAVYIGPASFGARHAAGNSTEDIAALCRYAHQYGVEVYATVNTVLYDSELDEAVALVRMLTENGVDAIIVQDMGLMQHMAHDRQQDAGMQTDIVWHASTQTDNRTKEKVRWLKDMGVSRVVLARELTLDEISEIHAAEPDIELEAFVHGALCVSFSGQCYASQHCFSRSANRGACAQLCRMKYSLVDADGAQVADDAYYLSLKDQCQIDNLEAMIDAGVCSLKIEGRLKDEAYVKNVVAAYSQELNRIIAKHNAYVTENGADSPMYCRSSWGRVEISFTPDLRRSFNRGYTTYFINGRKDDIASFMTPKAIGEYVGKVKEIRHGRQPSFNVAGMAAFVNGDGLCYMNSHNELKGFRVNRAEGNRLFPHMMPDDLLPGTPLYRSQDMAFDKMMAQRTAERLIPVDIRLIDCGDSIRMTVEGAPMEHGAGYLSSAPLYGEAVMVLNERDAAKKPQRENMIRQVSRLGDTRYVCSSVVVDDSLDGVFVPSSALADLRRRTIDSMSVREQEGTSAAKESVCSDNRAQLLMGGSANVPMPANEYYRKYPYLYNATNDKARELYAQYGAEAAGFERDENDNCSQRCNSVNDTADKILMQCKHCIRYSLGYCVKNGGRKPFWRDPLSLRLSDGRMFRLQFDCKNCQMNVLQ